MVRPNKMRENIRSALKSVEQVFDDNSETVSGLPALDEAVQKFKADQGTYLSGEEAFNLAMNGKTEAKHSAEALLEDAVYLLSRALKAYAKKANKPDIFELADYEEYELERMRDTDLLNHARMVLTKANEVSAELVKYSVTPEELTGVQAKIDAYEKALKEQGAAMATQSSEFEAMLLALETVKENLEYIDDLIDRERNNHPKFCSAYESARRVKALGTRHKPALADSTASEA